MDINFAIYFTAFLIVFFGWLSSHSASTVWAWKVWLGFFVVTDGLIWFAYACSVMADKQ